jgi:hypothetical protein
MSIFESKLDTDIDLSADALYAALDDIRDISLGIRHADDGQYQEELEAVALELAYDGESEINKVALAKGLRFFPKYLNETTQEYPDYGPSFIPATVRSHGQ